MMIPSVVTLGISTRFLKRFNEHMTDINDISRKFYRTRTLIMTGVTFLMVSTLIAALLNVAKDTSVGLIQIGGFTAFWVASWRIQVAIIGLGSTLFNISEAEFNIFNMRELFALRNTLPPCGEIHPNKR